MFADYRCKIKYSSLLSFLLPQITYLYDSCLRQPQRFQPELLSSGGPVRIEICNT